MRRKLWRNFGALLYRTYGRLPQIVIFKSKQINMDAIWQNLARSCGDRNAPSNGGLVDIHIMESKWDNSKVKWSVRTFNLIAKILFYLLFSWVNSQSMDAYIFSKDKRTTDDDQTTFLIFFVVVYAQSRNIFFRLS